MNNYYIFMRAFAIYVIGSTIILLIVIQITTIIGAHGGLVDNSVYS